MVSEIRDFLEQGKVCFGIKECLKRKSNIKKVVVSRDCREDVKKVLSANKIDFHVSDFSKQDIAGKLGIDFKCEVFGLKK